MCMNDGPFLLVDGDREIALDDIASLLTLNGQLRLVDVFGKQRDLTGSISEIDLLNRRIVLA